MTAFDTAWDLLKAPYHGTTTDVLPSIMREGIQPRRADPFTPPLVFYTNNPEQAMAFAKIRAESSSSSSITRTTTTRQQQGNEYE